MGINEILKKNILILDGAFGTTIQKFGFKEEDFRGREFINHSKPLFGFNDILNLTKPSTIKEIHKAYLESGANIITTNTFNSNSISIKDYFDADTDDLIFRLNREGAILAKEAVKEFQHHNGPGIFFVAGSIGPTNRSASLSPDISNPLIRNITYDELKNSYKKQIQGLIEGGADILLFETFFDTLNLKAGVAAANQIMAEKNKTLPIMVSATISDNSGRILSGQTIEAFVTSISHLNNISIIGINCSFGPEKMYEYVERLHNINNHFTSCHPNAGLPDAEGCYDVSPQEFKDCIKIFLEKGLVNIIGGCCGTTPEYIKEISKIVKFYKPSQPKKEDNKLRLSGLDILTVTDAFIKVGERCNVAGSSKFLKLIKDGLLEEASVIAKNQIENGAQIIDINMDDALLNSEEEMIRFVRYISAEPEVSKVPFMIDSSKWNTIESALKNIQGKGIVNSLSLKEGEEIFIERAKKIKELGFALVVMAFDEKGQADTFERKIEICQRSYNILTKACDFNPEDIIFDVNVLTIGTGMKEHSRYAVDFINAVSWIKENLPGVRTSGGVSNLSFAFRGKNYIRDIMHEIFLFHAKKAGLDMAIINPAKKLTYNEIDKPIRDIIEDIILDRNDNSLEKLITIATEVNKPKTNIVQDKEVSKILSISEILKEDLIKGEIIELEKHLERALQKMSDPVDIIQGPLMDGMKRVGDLFGEGKMFLPQVIKTARSMKKAVEILTPYIEKKRENSEKNKKGKILIATVKGDVHDIGKNIVSTVLSCNNYEVIDLGIMVPGDKIVETALQEKPDIICLSGLITPSLNEMTETVKQLSDAGIDVPIMVGGAATSLLHTALKIDPAYRGIVLHMGDASQNPIASNKLLNTELREIYLAEIKKEYEKLRSNTNKNINILPYEKVLSIVSDRNFNNVIEEKPKYKIGESIVINLDLKEICGFINWKMFFLAWKIQGSFLKSFPYSNNEEIIENWLKEVEEEDRLKALESLQLYNTAIKMIEAMIRDNSLDGKGIFKFEKAKGDKKNLYIKGKKFPMLRQQKEGTDFLSCCDFIGNDDNSYIGLFAVTAGNQIYLKAKEIEKSGDNYNSLVLQTLADRIVEAGAEWLQGYIKMNYWDVKIRPAWGYPMLPDQTLILETQNLLDYDQIGIKLTENGAMFPPASISGIYFSNPKAKYFMVGEIGVDQLKDYSQRREMTEERVKEILRYL